MSLLDSDQPSLLACMAAAVEGHHALRRQALAPEPVRPGQVAIQKLLSGDTKGALRVMQQIDQRTDPDPDDAHRRRVGNHLAGERVRAQALGKSAAPLTILKRIDEPEEGVMTYDEIAKLERQAEVLLKRVNNALADADDDATVEDTWSEHADAAAPGNNASLDADDDTELDEEDDDDLGINKATDKEIFFDDRHRNMGPTPVDQEHPAHPYQVSTTPATRSARPHKFDRLTEHVMDRDRCSRSEAMSTARREYPDVYQSYQDFHAASPTNEQATRRAIGQRYNIGKRAPETYEDMVAAEMRKGCTMEIAGQRVLQQHGSAALRKRALGKRSDPRLLTKRLDARIDDVCQEFGCERTEALRALRKSGEYYW